MGIQKQSLVKTKQKITRRAKNKAGKFYTVRHHCCLLLLLLSQHWYYLCPCVHLEVIDVVDQPTPPRLSDRLSICRCTVCCLRLRSTSAEKEEGDRKLYIDFLVCLSILCPAKCVASHPAFCPVHAEHFVLVGSQVIQRSLTAGRQCGSINVLIAGCAARQEVYSRYVEWWGHPALRVWETVHVL